MHNNFDKIIKIVSGAVLILIALSLLIAGIAPNTFIISAKTAFDFISGGFSALSFYSIIVIFIFVLIFLSLGLSLLFTSVDKAIEGIKVTKSDFGDVFVSQFVVVDLVKYNLSNYDGLSLKKYKIEHLDDKINLKLSIVTNSDLNLAKLNDVKLKKDICDSIEEFLGLTVIDININYEFEVAKVNSSKKEPEITENKQ